MIKNLQRFSVWQRRLIFFSIFGGVIVALIAFTWILINQTLNSGVRVTAVPLNAQTTVHQFAALPDDNAYPSSVAVAPDGTVYTGSFATGAIWEISPSGGVTEVPGTRDAIGAVMGLAVASDGSLLVVDQLDTDPRSSGGKILRVHDGMVTPFTDTKFVSPIDVTIDSAGHVYVTDSGTNQVWRFDADGSNGAVWWTSPAQASGSTHPAATGLAYDATRDAIIVTDPEFNTIYRVKVSDASTETLYSHGSQPDAPGFDGATVTPDGTLYVAALAQNGIVKVADGKIEYIAGMFRGPSDVAFAAPNKLYVTNFDQTSIVIPVVHPQLPFALDVVELEVEKHSTTKTTKEREKIQRKDAKVQRRKEGKDEGAKGS